MTDLQKVQGASLLNATRFWMVTFILYLNERGIPLDQAFWLMGLYYVLTLLLEYPTGVIGDYYSHKVSVSWGFLLLSATFLLLTLPGGLPYYIFVICLLALASSLISGSDTALFHSVAKDFKTQWANLNALSIVVMFAGITFGGFVAAWDLRYPLYLSAIAYCIAALLIISLTKYQYARDSDDMLLAARAGLKYVFSRRQLLFTILLSAVIGAFFYDYKWLYNPLFDAAGIPLPWWGLVSGIAILCIGLGAKVTTRYPKLPWPILILGTGVAIACAGQSSWLGLVMGGLFVSHFLRGYMETTLMVDMNEQIVGKVRSSVLSLNSVLIRTGAALYLGIGGLLLGKVSLAWFMLATGLVFSCLLFFLFFRLKKV